MEFGILGPLEVHDGGRPVEVRGPKVRSLLAALVLQAGRVVSKDRLVDILWGPEPPDAALATLQSHIAHLRSTLEPGRTSRASTVLVTRDPGYVLDVDPVEQIDAGRFERLVAEGRQALAGEDVESAAARLWMGLDLWRGDPLTEFTFEPFAQGEIARLGELRLAALEDRIDADLALGRHVEVTTELSRLVADHPLRERFWGQLMLALYRGGRQADALRAFAELRHVLVEQLGIEPSPELARLEEEILLQKRELILPRSGPRGSRAPTFTAAPVTGVSLASAVRSPEESLAAGLEAWGRRAWDQAFDLLSAAERDGVMQPAHLGALAEAAFWSGRPGEFINVYQRIHTFCLDSDNPRGAALAALLIAVAHAFRLRLAMAQGWFAVASRLLEAQPECAEHGYQAWAMGTVLLVMGTDNPGAVLDQADRVLKSAELYADRDLHAVGLTYRGYTLIHQGELSEGLPLLDQAMASVVTGAVGPLATAAVICRTLSACIDLHDYGRAAEWLGAVEQRSGEYGLVGFPGDCRMHQAQLLLARGAWADAELQARRACSEMDDFARERTGLAFSVLGDVRRLRGDIARAADAYRRADEMGRTPQPGMALLLLAAGDVASALASVRQALDVERWNVLSRSRLLAAHVDIALAAGDAEAAAGSAADLSGLATDFPTAGLAATAHYAAGVVALASDATTEAIRLLRTSWREWRGIGVTHESARARLQLGAALSVDGDRAAGRLEVQAARASFEHLGARPDAEAARRLADRLSRSG